MLIGVITIIVAGLLWLMADEWTSREWYIVQKIKLAQIGNPAPRFFFVDSNFIDLAYDILHLAEFNPDSFGTFIQTVDNVLEMRYDIERGVVERCDLNFTVAKHNYEEAMNALESIKLSIPPSETLYLLHHRNAMKLARLYILRNLDSMRDSCYKDAVSVGLGPNMPFINTGLDAI
jgi:hypothetical protein